jgi:DNA polymerase-3 subunit gamma/tau
MSLVLYRKYRPQTFKEVIGQKHIIQILQNEIRQDKVAHAYLFAGPRGVGKTTVARILAKTINCEKVQKEPSFRQKGEPCNVCSICSEMNAGRSFDLIEIDAASNRGINEIRELRERVRFPPSRNKYKVFIVDEVHMLTTEAFNALLKTLEEPPSYIVFILATTEIHKVPETIISRCQTFNFVKVDSKEIIKRLKEIVKKEGIEVDEEVLKNIVYRSEGCVRDAESLLSQVLTLDGKRVTLEQATLILPSTQINYIFKLLENIVKKDATSALKLIIELSENGIDLQQFVKDLIEVLRKILLLQVGLESRLVLVEFDDQTKETLQKFAKLIEAKSLVTMIEEFIGAQQSLDYAEIPQLPLELAIVRLIL